MNPPSVDVRQKLIDGNIVLEENVFVGADPLTHLGPFITLTDTGGSANPKWLRDAPTMQMRVRGRTNEYGEAYELMRRARDYLLGITPWTVGDAIYTRILIVSDIMFLGYGPNNRPLFSANFRLGVDYTDATGTNREVIA